MSGKYWLSTEGAPTEEIDGSERMLGDIDVVERLNKQAATIAAQARVIEAAKRYRGVCSYAADESESMPALRDLHNTLDALPDSPTPAACPDCERMREALKLAGLLAGNSLIPVELWPLRDSFLEARSALAQSEDQAEGGKLIRDRSTLEKDTWWGSVQEAAASVPKIKYRPALIEQPDGEGD